MLFISLFATFLSIKAMAFFQFLPTNILLTLLVLVDPYAYFSNEKAKFEFYSTLLGHPILGKSWEGFVI